MQGEEGGGGEGEVWRGRAEDWKRGGGGEDLKRRVRGRGEEGGGEKSDIPLICCFVSVVVYDL